MKIFTKPILKAFEKQGKTAHLKMSEIKIIMKLFNPVGAATWYVYEKTDERYYEAFVNLGNSMDAECGTIDMEEILNFRGAFGLGIERDMHFEPMSMTLEEVYNKIKEGGHV